MVINLCLVDLEVVNRGPMADLETIAKSHAIFDLLKGDAGVAMIIVRD